MLRKKLNKTQNKKNYCQNLEASNKQFTSPFWRLGLWAILPTLFYLGLLGSIELVIELVQRVQDCFTHIPDIWDSWKNGLIWIIQVRTLHTNFLGQWTSDMANQSFLKKMQRGSCQSSWRQDLKARLVTAICSQYLSYSVGQM